MNSFTLALPIPTRLNAMYSNRSKPGQRGRMLSKEYVAWKKEADAALWSQKPLPSFLGRVAILIDCGETKGLSDIDGRVKPLCDFLVKHKIIVNDDRRYVRMIIAQWSSTRKDCQVTITEHS